MTTQRIFAMAFAALLATSGAWAEHRMNKSIKVGDGESRSEDLSTMNGSITVGDGCEIDGDCSTMNGPFSRGAPLRRTIQKQSALKAQNSSAQGLRSVPWVKGSQRSNPEGVSPPRTLAKKVSVQGASIQKTRKKLSKKGAGKGARASRPR